MTWNSTGAEPDQEEVLQTKFPPMWHERTLITLPTSYLCSIAPNTTQASTLLQAAQLLLWVLPCNCCLQWGTASLFLIEMI